MAAHLKVFDGVCREMDCEPVNLTLREGAIPVQIRGHRNIKEPLMQLFHDELMSQVEQGLVRSVPPGAITPFISGIVTMPKDSVSGGVHITVDFRELNKWLVGNVFPNKTPFEATVVAARHLLSNVPALAYYDPFRSTELFSDDSRLRGLGFILKEQQSDGQWRMLQAGSRFITPAKSRYAMIELESLGAAWAMSKCKQFLEGLPTFEL
uniref:Reverse transcriptase/retrotransposon-derived protein RNase H-like domain-containing protein n=1 Tax=Daphnia galeata TaxID=27404 RepID=A0A8J2WE72_9CRUS|nr:unnamed protein product [Daphnia galeata]